MNEQVSTEDDRRLSEGAASLETQSKGLNDRLQSLLDVFSEAGEGLRGDALRKYEEGQAELVAGFQGLVRWCDKYGVNLTLGQETINRTDAESAEEFQKAKEDLGGSFLTGKP